MRLILAAVMVATLAGSAHAQDCSAANGCGNILFDGDSISAGVGTSPGHRPDQLMRQSLRVPTVAHNVAVGGRPVSDCLAGYAADVAPHFLPDAAWNLIVFHAGDNDIAQGRDAATTYRAFTQYVALAHRQGWKLLASTELPRLGFRPDQEAQLDAYNRLLLANAAHADVVVDLSQEPRLYAPAGRAEGGWYSKDMVHPDDAGYGLLNDLLAAAWVARTE